MHFPKPRFSPLPLAYKLLGIVLIACFLVLGVIGLILPIIPGLVFLLLAIYVLTRVSRRAAAYAHNQPWISAHLRHLEAAGKLTVAQRMKLGLLLAARGTLNALTWCAGALRGRNTQR